MYNEIASGRGLILYWNPYFHDGAGVFNGFGHNSLRGRARVIPFSFMFPNPYVFFSHT